MRERGVLFTIVPYFWPAHQDRRDNGERPNRVDVDIKRAHGIGRPFGTRAPVDPRECFVQRPDSPS